MRRNVLEGLRPEPVWSIFEGITKIPRPSGKEERIRSWIKSWAERHALQAQEDRVGNLLLRKSPSPGKHRSEIRAPTLVLQAHLDMVCEKESGSSFDFEREPLRIKIEGGHVAAEGTTLGADNGIGAALALAALIDDDLGRWPLEVLLTSGEETGFTGAFGMERGFFTGRYILNLDSEKLGEVTIGSAGGFNTEHALPVSDVFIKNATGIEVKIEGLLSGHSGVHIHLPRLNAIKVLAAGLTVLRDSVEFLIENISGGSALNAIPAFARCTVLVEKENEQRALSFLTRWRSEAIKRAKKIEPHMRIIIHSSQSARNSARGDSGSPETAKSGTGMKPDAVLQLVEEIPHGVLSFSSSIEGLVQTSSNLARIAGGRAEVRIHSHSRSSIEAELSELRERLKTLGTRSGTRVIQDAGYPGWEADPSSSFVQLVKQACEAVLKKDARLNAVHAGLECGVFARLDPELEIASIGPDIDGAHTTGEKVQIESVGLTWEVLKRVIEDTAELE